jgi:hypothetical protein
MATYSGTTYNTPTYGVVGSGTSSDTIFTRYLNIDIIDITNSGNGKVKKVYEEMKKKDPKTLFKHALVETAKRKKAGKL